MPLHPDVQEITGAAVWDGSGLASDAGMFYFDDADCRALVEVADSLRGRNLDEVRRAELQVPRLAERLGAVALELQKGHGFALMRGLPANDLPSEIVEIIYWVLGAQLGIGVSQSAAGDRLGRVYDRGTGDKERYYTRGGPLEFHVDPVDVVGLLCMRPAISGGASRIVSAGAVHNTILAERPDLLRVLYQGFHNSRRGHGERKPSHRVPVFARVDASLECYLLPQTIRQATEEGYPLSEPEKDALDYFAEVANRPGLYLDMNFGVGDVQFLNNRTILHSRTDYQDHPEPEKKRMLLRLWLMMPEWPARPASMQMHSNVDRAGGGVRPSVARS